MPSKKLPLHLKEGQSVKNLKRKISKIGRPSVFIGSSWESISIAEKVQSYFEKNIFEVDVWHQGIFALTETHGGKARNAEQLKNFTDIYDFAIFLFSPDDKILSQFRMDESGKYKEALAVRHNVVFEFGLFLGRIGAKRTFILFDDNSSSFINNFFTDLKENITDVKDIKDQDVEENNKFRIELYSYKSTFIDDKYCIDYTDLETQVAQIKNRITKTFKGIDISFLPATSLAIGYYNNFIKIALESLFNIVSGSLSPFAKEEIEKKLEIKSLVETFLKCQIHRFKVIIPNSLKEADPDFIKPFLENHSDKKEIPGKSRNMSILVKKPSYKSDKNIFTIYDVPTTMSSSFEAINMLNPHKDIKELLSEKERVTFIKALKFKINQEKNIALKGFMKKTIKFITWDQFLKESSGYSAPNQDS